MGLKDILNAGKIRRENEGLKELMTPEMQDAAKLNEKIVELEIQKEKLEKQTEKLYRTIDKLKQEAIFFEDAITFQDFGLYTPRYNFLTAEEYKIALEKIRTDQKEMIKTDTAISGNQNWTVNGSKSAGKKMIKDMKKLFLRAFNSDCEDVITRVKYNNFDMSLKKIRQSAESIEKLGKTMSLLITSKYINSKIDELHLAFEYQEKKQEEKDAQKAARAEMREAAKLQKEIAERRKKVEKEQTHYQTAYEKLLKQIELNPNSEDLLVKKAELENHLKDIDKSLSDIDYREANQRAGYVYVISNIGAFGENVYKIGMTRRLDPQDRIDELGDASVPFNFDVHAMIFSDDAPALESALHRAFEDRKLNMVNTRREFFNVTLKEIKEVVRKNFDKTVEFIDIPDAEQYRVSQKLRQPINKANNRIDINPLQFYALEMDTLNYVKGLLPPDKNIIYGKTEEYAYLQLGNSSRNWICRVYIRQSNNLFVLHKFNDTSYECEYYFESVDLLDLISELIQDVYNRCRANNK